MEEVAATDEIMRTPEGLTLRPLNLERDAEALVRMWHDSDGQWPGTFLEGALLTGDTVRDWLNREERLDTLVWDTGDGIAAYCSLWRRYHAPDVYYIALLNVAPAYQKAGLARRMLVHYVEHVARLGARRLDLHTWSGNLKAVPLYKKCGFCWVPGTSVEMHNYLPLILRLPYAREFFDRHDWYQALRPDLRQDADDERWEGAPVFTYRFEADGERLLVRIDRVAGRVIAVETDAFTATLGVADAEPPAGLPAPLRWRVSNHGKHSLRVVLVANGSGPIGLDYRATATIDPAASGEWTAEASTGETPAEPAAPDGPSVHSTLVLGDEVVELATALRPRPAIAVTTDPPHVTLTPGQSQTVHLQLTSHLEADATATVSLAPPAGLTTDWTAQAVVVPGRGARSLPLVLRAGDGGVYQLPVAVAADIAGRTVRVAPVDVAVFALPLGGVLAAMADGAARVETETTRVLVAPEGGRIRVFDRASGQQLLEHGAYAVPPERPSEFRRGRFEVAVMHDGGEAQVVATIASREQPGLVLTKRLSVAAAGIIRLVVELANSSDAPRTLRVRHMLHGRQDATLLTLPLIDGPVQGPWASFPGLVYDAYADPRRYAEQWAAFELPEATAGVIWSGPLARIDWPDIETSPLTVPAQGRVSAPPLYLLAAEGDWRMVQRRWRRLIGQSPLEVGHEPVPRPPLAVRSEPPAVVMVGEETRLTLHMAHERMRAATGRVVLDLPPGWSATPHEVSFTEVTGRSPAAATVTLRSDRAPGAAMGTIRLQSPEGQANTDLPLIRLGDGGIVTVAAPGIDQQPHWRVDNGRLDIDVTPQHGGTVSGLRDGGVEHLASSYPDVSAIGWMSPWHGGLTPVVLPGDGDDLPGDLWRARFTAEAVEVVDDHGIAWRGVRQTVHDLPERLRGLAVWIDTLTVGGSPVVRQVLRLQSSRPLAGWRAGWLAFVQPGGSQTGTIGWGPGDQIIQSDRVVWRRTGPWAAVENPSTNDVLVLVGAQPEAGIATWGSAGVHLSYLQTVRAGPGRLVEIVAFLVLAKSLEEARAYAGLRHLTQPAPRT